MSKTYIVALLVAIASILPATPTQAQVNLRRISIGASYWAPSLDYWNDRSFLRTYANGQGVRLSGNVMPTAALEVGLVKNLSLGARVGYYSNTASSSVNVGGTTRNEDFTLSIIPVAADLTYTFAGKQTDKTPILTPYVGVSVARYFINTELNRVVVANPGTLNEKQSGNSYGVQAFAGAERKLVKLLYVALDLRYHLGSYNQQVRTESTSTTEKVSLNGVEAGLSLRLKFE